MVRVIDGHPMLAVWCSGRVDHVRVRHLVVRLIHVVIAGRGVVGEAALRHGLVAAHITSTEPVGLIVATAS